MSVVLCPEKDEIYSYNNFSYTGLLRQSRKFIYIVT